MLVRYQALLGLFILSLFTANTLASSDNDSCFTLTNATKVILNYHFDTNDADMIAEPINHDDNEIPRLYPIRFCANGTENTPNADTLVRMENYDHLAKQIGMHLSIIRDHNSDGSFNGNFFVTAVDWSDDGYIQHCWFDGHEPNDVVHVQQGDTLRLQCRWKKHHQ